MSVSERWHRNILVQDREGRVKTRGVLKEEVQKELVILVMQRCISVHSTETNTQGETQHYTQNAAQICIELP